MKDESVTLVGEKAEVSLTIEATIAAVAREFNMVPESLRGSMSADSSRVTVALADSTDRFIVRTLGQAKQERIAEISRSILEDTLMEDLYEIAHPEILAVLLGQVDLTELEPWIVSSTRRVVRDVARDDRDAFWNLWAESKLKPTVPFESRDFVYPSFTMVKDLQDHLTGFNCGDKARGLMDLCDGEHETACEVLLEQCHLNGEKAAAAFLQDHDRDFFGGQVTSEGFVIETD